MRLLQFKGQPAGDGTLERRRPEERKHCFSYIFKSSVYYFSFFPRRLGGQWTQQKPTDTFMVSQARKGPPILPPHLLQVSNS